MKFKVGDEYIYQYPGEPAERAVIVSIEPTIIRFLYTKQNGATQRAFDYIENVVEFYRKVKPINTKLGKVLYK